MGKDILIRVRHKHSPVCLADDVAGELLMEIGGLAIRENTLSQPVCPLRVVHQQGFLGQSQIGFGDPPGLSVTDR